MYIILIMQTFSIAEARSQLPKIIHAVETGEVTQLTRRGKPVAVLLSLKEYQALIHQGQGGLNQALLAFQALRQDENNDISDEEINSWRDKSSPREGAWD